MKIEIIVTDNDERFLARAKVENEEGLTESDWNMAVENLGRLQRFLNKK